MRALIVSCSLIAIILVAAALWWRSITPSNDRDWAPDVARMTTGSLSLATHSGKRATIETSSTAPLASDATELVTLHNVRNFTWRSETDIDERWETRHYDLAQLSSVDLIVSYWTIPAIAHTLVSFGFDDGRHVVFSVEIRKEKGEEFSEIGGFLKRFELSVVAADERDIIGVRSKVRDEKVFLFRTQLNAADRRALFLAYIDEANTLAATPRFYHTLTANCTTIVFGMMQRIIGDLPWDYRLLASGYLPNYVYDLGGLDTRYDFAILERMGYVSRRVNAALSDAAAADAKEASGVEFSRAIRVGIPELSGKN
ncbi:MAG: hypothetical protein ACI87C_001784 [Paraperlucidibaca sp.]